MLGKLALHYYRPDFTAEQAKMVMGDYLDDLEPYSATDVAYACEQYRKQPKSDFFPKIGQLIALINPKRPAWDIPPSHLPKYSAREHLLLEAKRATRSVAEVLRDAGHENAARQWEGWKAMSDRRQAARRGT